MAVLALLGGACTARASSGSAGSGSTAAQPLDLYAATPPLSDIQTMLGDTTWWPAAPSFTVRPLDIASFPATEQFSVTQPYVHVGTAERFGIDYTLWDSASVASSQMSAIQTALGSGAGPKVGDQALYYGTQDATAAPYFVEIFVRVGPVLATISWHRKSAFPTAAQLVKIAGDAASRLKDVVSGKLHGTQLTDPDAALLPPGGFDITLLAGARISVEAAIAMIGLPIIDAPARELRGMGLNDVLFGDYALDADTQMEVRASVFNFTSAKDATTWFDFLRGTTVAQANGVVVVYDPTRGEYLAFFASGTMTGLLICRNIAAPVLAISPIDPLVAASRACEAPLDRVSSSWKVTIAL